VSWSDLTLKGFSIEASVGLRCELASYFALDATFAVRESKLTSSGLGAVNGYGFSPGVSGALGAVFLLR